MTIFPFLCWEGENLNDGSGVVLCGVCSSLSIHSSAGICQTHLDVLCVKFVWSISHEYVSARCGIFYLIHL